MNKKQVKNLIRYLDNIKHKCDKCKKEKEIAFIHKNKKFGNKYYCKSCTKKPKWKAYK